MVQTNIMRPSSDGADLRGDSGGGSSADVAAVVHRVRKLDSNLLGMSHAFGNFNYKSNAGLPPSQQAVVCTPNIAMRECAYNEDMYLILACNGIWDIMSNKDMGGFVAGYVEELWQDLSNNDDDNNKFPRGEVLTRVGDKLLTLCLNA
jgi:serine/threonine protein phosphatase PrpC